MAPCVSSLVFSILILPAALSLRLGSSEIPLLDWLRKNSTFIDQALTKLKDATYTPSAGETG
jgi:hypothetical protein